MKHDEQEVAGDDGNDNVREIINGITHALSGYNFARLEGQTVAAPGVQNGQEACSLSDRDRTCLFPSDEKGSILWALGPHSVSLGGRSVVRHGCRCVRFDNLSLVSRAQLYQGISQELLH